MKYLTIFIMLITTSCVSVEKTESNFTFNAGEHDIGTIWQQGGNILFLGDGGIAFYKKALDKKPSLALTSAGKFMVNGKPIANDYDVYIAMKAWLKEHYKGGLAPCEKQINLEEK